jgi:hypothetical protein
MNTEEFEKATEKDLRRKANDSFDKLKDSGSQEWPALLLSAQFYMDEIERREHDRVAKRDLLLELVVILLIGLELYFGITGGNAQLDVLQKLNASASQTATAVGVVAEEQKSALDAIRQLDERVQKQNQKQPPPKEGHKNDD